MKVHALKEMPLGCRSGYYQWLNNPISKTEQENIVILDEIKKSYKESDCIYGYRNIHKDLQELGFKINRKRVARLMSKAGIYGLGMYKKKPKSMSGPLHKAHPNLLKQYFFTSNPNEDLVSDRNIKNIY